MLPYDIIRLDYKERPDDRFLATHLHRFEMFTKPVAIAVVVEILNPWHPTSEIGQKIVNDLVRGFLASDAQSFLTRFESSLKQVNRTVQDIMGKSKAPVSCVAVLLEEEQIHCAGIGQAKLGLLRNGKLATILGGKNSTEETFAAVTSGDLRDGDWLFIANHAFYSLLSKLNDDIWTLSDVSEIAERITEQNRNNQAINQAGIMLRFKTDATETNQTVLWENPVTAKLSVSKVSFNWSKKRGGQLLGIVAKIGTLTSAIFQRVRRLIPVYSKKIGDDLSSRSVDNRPKSWLTLKRLVPAVIVLIIIGVGVTVIYKQTHRKLVSVPAESSLLSKIQSEPATQILKTLLEKFSFSGYQNLDEDDKKQLAIILASQNIQLTNLPSPLAQTPTEISAIDAVGDQLALIDSRGQTWVFNNSLLIQQNQRQLIANPASLTSFDTNKFLVTDISGNLWLLTNTSDLPQALVQPVAVGEGVKLADHYQGNLYFIAQETNTTFRVSGFDKDLAGTTIYNKGENLAIGKVSDLAINGKVLAVDIQGKLVEFVRNKIAATKFQLPLVEDPTHLAASDNSPTTVISSGRLLFLLGKDYNLTSTVFLTTDDKITGIALSQNGKKLWLTLGRNIFSFDLP